MASSQDRRIRSGARDSQWIVSGDGVWDVFSDRCGGFAADYRTVGR